MAVANYSRSIPDILTDVVTQFTTLLRKEGQLARAEVSENMSRLAAGIGLVVGGAVLLIPALVILLEAAVVAISEIYLIAPHLSALLVGGVVLVLGLIFLMVGMGRFKARYLMPDRTMHQLQRDAAMARHQMDGRDQP